MQKTSQDSKTAWPCWMCDAKVALVVVIVKISPPADCTIQNQKVPCAKCPRTIRGAQELPTNHPGHPETSTNHPGEQRCPLHPGHPERPTQCPGHQHGSLCAVASPWSGLERPLAEPPPRAAGRGQPLTAQTTVAARQLSSSAPDSPCSLQLSRGLNWTKCEATP